MLYLIIIVTNSFLLKVASFKQFGILKKFFRDFSSEIYVKLNELTSLFKQQFIIKYMKVCLSVIFGLPKLLK